MPENKVIIESNANFHHMAGENLFKRDEECFIEYRKKWKTWPENFYLGEFPLFIDIEVTSNCNLRCPFCATTFKDKMIKKGFISIEIVKRIIDEGADSNLYGVKFNIRGEPLLHKQIDEFVAYAKRKGLIDVYFNTNAMLLSKEVSKKLINAGLDRISVSIEGYTKDVFDKYRVGANFETILSNIEGLQSLKRKYGVIYPKVRVQTIMTPDLENIFEDYRIFWEKRVDEVGFLDYKHMKSKKKGLHYAWACPQIWQRMAVFWDGTILPCNHDDEALLSLGNIKQVSIKDAWHSKKLCKVREIHRKGLAHKISACDGCYLRDSEIMKLKSNKAAL